MEVWTFLTTDDCGDNVQTFAADLQGGGSFGMTCEDGACTLLEKAARAPAGTEPKWGQVGDFVRVIEGVAVWIEYDGLYGVGMDLGGAC